MKLGVVGDREPRKDSLNIQAKSKHRADQEMFQSLYHCKADYY